MWQVGPFSQKDCRVLTSKSHYEISKKKQVLVATQSDEEYDEAKKEVNLALMSQSSYSSGEEDNEVNNSSHKELIDAFKSFNNEEIFKLNQVLKKKNDARALACTGRLLRSPTRSAGQTLQQNSGGWSLMAA